MNKIRIKIKNGYINTVANMEIIRRGKCEHCGQEIHIIPTPFGDIPVRACNDKKTWETHMFVCPDSFLSRERKIEEALNKQRCNTLNHIDGKKMYDKKNLFRR